MTIVPKRPPLPLDQLNLEPLDDLDQDTRAELEQRLEDSQQCASMREQLALLREPYHSAEGTPPYSLLADIFGVSRGTVHNQIQRFRRETASGGPRPSGRPPVLSPEQMQLVIEKISTDYYNRELCTYPSLSRWLEEEHGLSILPDTLGAIIRSHQECQAVLAPVMEDKRCECSTEAIDEYFEEFARLANDRPASLICNLDEMGYLESQDRRKQVCIVPAGIDPRTVRIPVDRQKRRLTILQCVFADGTKVKPAVVLPRKTAERELLDIGIVPEHCLLFYQENGFMTSDIFMSWADQVLFPELERRIEQVADLNREYELGLDEEQIRGLLVMDGLKQHFTDYFEDECFVNCIDILELPAHSSDQTQPCDLCLFAACKRMMPSVHADGEQNQTKDVSRLVSAMHSACSPSNIRKSFKRAGLVTYYHGSIEEGGGLLLSRVDPTNCTQVRHFPTRSRQERIESDSSLLERLHEEDELAPPRHFRISSTPWSGREEKPTIFRRWAQRDTAAEEEDLDAIESGPIWRPLDEGTSHFQDILDDQFPDGTDYLRTPENWAKVSSWLHQRDDTGRAPPRTNRIRAPPALEQTEPQALPVGNPLQAGALVMPHMTMQHTSPLPQGLIMPPFVMQAPVMMQPTPPGVFMPGTASGSWSNWGNPGWMVRQSRAPNPWRRPK